MLAAETTMGFTVPFASARKCKKSVKVDGSNAGRPSQTWWSGQEFRTGKFGGTPRYIILDITSLREVSLK